MTSNHGLRDLWRIIGVAVLLALGWIAYSLANEYGFVPHTRAVEAYMPNDWAIDENKTCQGLYIERHGDERDLGVINCSEKEYKSGSSRNINIKFWGKVSRTDLVNTWRCNRKPDGFTCYALN